MGQPERITRGPIKTEVLNSSLQVGVQVRMRNLALRSRRIKPGFLGSSSNKAPQELDLIVISA